ncbi:MAG: AMP-binding protein, partial [Dehalococcoidia bacterium]|nr:AMP-binding protein [Dehalococcoidia bacterium]
MLRSTVSVKASQSRYWDERWQTMPREELDREHLQRIQRLIKYAHDNIPLYRRLYDGVGLKPEDVRTWEDFFHKVPFTDKKEFLADQADRPYGGQGVELEHGLHIFQTTGTTGTPLREIISRYDEYSLAEPILAEMWDLGIRPGDSVYYCFHFGIWVGLWAFYWCARRLGLQVLSGGGLGSEDRVRHIMTLKPTMVLATPTYALHLADVAKGMGVDLREAGVKYLIGGGEPGFGVEATRRALTERWGPQVVISETYGIGECMFAGVECNEHPGGVHVPEKTCHAYSADPETGEKVGEGQVGENVVTSLMRGAQVFIKYRSHDLVERYDHFDHGCGWTWAFLKGGVLGRTDNMIVIRGVNVYPSAVEDLLGQVAGTTSYYEMHVTREEGMDRLKVKVEASDDVESGQYADVA